MITLVEKQIKVLDREYLYNLVEEQEDINDFTKDLLLDFIDGICTELSELGFQMNRQPMNLYIHREYTDMKKNFVNLINDLVDVDLSSSFERDRLIQNFQNNIETFIDNLEGLVKNNVAEQIEMCREKVTAYIANFITNSNGLLDIEEENDNLTVDEANNIYAPKHFSMKGSKSFETPTKNKFKGKKFTRIYRK